VFIGGVNENRFTGSSAPNNEHVVLIGSNYEFVDLYIRVKPVKFCGCD
jgi:hypothetical protein